jgi:hypothetical protein
LAEAEKEIRDPETSGTESAWTAINFADKMTALLPALIAHAERSEAMLIEERARFIMFAGLLSPAIPEGFVEFYLKKSDENKASKISEAAYALGIEAPAWKHIGPDEEDAIGSAIAELEDADYDTVHQVDVLRRLLP